MITKDIGAVAALCCWCSGSLLMAERINQEGRILGPAPVVTTPTLFNTTEADALVSTMQIFPVDNPWNEDIARRPILPNSDAMIAQIMADLPTNRWTLRAFYEMNYALVPDGQALAPIDFFNYPDESDPSPYPIPANLPIETWPVGTQGLTLQQWQQDINNDGGDRHAIIVQPGSGFIWETWLTRLVVTGWEASNGARFDLKSNVLRQATWTSGDAAGLPMFPALPRYDECLRGMVEHAMRLVVKRTRREFIYPARHYASTTPASATNVPAMGQRLRLKASFQIPSTWTIDEKAVLRGLKKYGALVADNGNFFSISVTPDDRRPSSAFDHLSTVSITNFEVIQTTGPTEGPRSPGAPVAAAGADQTVALGTAADLQGFVNFSPGSAAPVISWTSYSGPGAVTFGDAATTNTTAAFSAAGTYTLMLNADDGIHAVARDAIAITVTTGLMLNIARSGTNVVVDWLGGTAPFTLESSATLPAPRWNAELTTDSHSVVIPISGSAIYYRLRAQ